MKYNFELNLDANNALALILKQIKKDTMVLEFGPANGRMTKYLKEKLGCKVYTVEIDEDAAKDAAQFSEDIIVGDIEELAWTEKWENINFDYIIFADVLEHLRKPQEVLSRTKRILKEDGKVILSVPNVAHNSILINMYNNIFNYTSVGLLDNTHIHLFAYNTLKEICHYAGYYPVIEDATYSLVGENEISDSYQDVANEVAKVIKKKKYGNVYQFVFTLQKNDYVKYNEMHSDYRIKSHIPERTFKVYVDRGDGWTEDNCITYKISSPYKMNYNIVLENSENICAIRIDPLDANGAYKIEGIRIKDELGIKKYGIEDCICNGVCLNGCLYSNSDDPQIIIHGLGFKGEAELMLSVHYLYVDVEEEVMGDLMRLINMLEECTTELMTIKSQEHLLRERGGMLENELKLANEELERRAVELDNRMNVINIQEREIGELNNELKLANEELGRRIVELDNRMNVINSQREIIEKGWITKVKRIFKR